MPREGSKRSILGVLALQGKEEISSLTVMKGIDLKELKEELHYASRGK